MSWKAPKIVEVPVGMEINMYACAALCNARPIVNKQQINALWNSSIAVLANS